MIDSHCHFCFPELLAEREAVLTRMHAAGVRMALNVCTTLREAPQVVEFAQQHDGIYASVGVHPDYNEEAEPDVSTLVAAAAPDKVVAIGETGLDYYRLQEPLDWQRERFRVHIRAARETGKPLIVHTRAASADTLRILREERADEVGGVMHCFTESAEVARAALDLGFYISFSGILTFKSAQELRTVAAMIPDDRLLIETDAPFLAPVPHRGKTNEPAWVCAVAEALATVRGQTLAQIEATTDSNFLRLFNVLRK